jgi:hypothetical protein
VTHMIHEMLALQFAAQRSAELQATAHYEAALRTEKPRKDVMDLAIAKHQVASERRMLSSLRLRTGI